MEPKEQLYANALEHELAQRYPENEGWMWHRRILFEHTYLTHVLRHRKHPTVLVAPMPIPVVSPRHVALAQHLRKAFAQCVNGGPSVVVLAYGHLLQAPQTLAEGVRIINMVVEPTPEEELDNHRHAYCN
jgi:hypothetical protein